MLRPLLALLALALAAPSSAALAQGRVELDSMPKGPFEVVVTGGGRKIVKQIEATCGE